MELNGTNIRLVRENLGWNQADLARAVGLSRSFVSQLESDSRGASPAVAQLIAEELGVNLDDLRPVQENRCATCGARVSYID